MRKLKKDSDATHKIQITNSDLNLYLIFFPFHLSASPFHHLHVQLISLMYRKLLLLPFVLYTNLINKMYEIMSLQIIRYYIQWIWLIVSYTKLPFLFCCQIEHDNPLKFSTWWMKIFCTFRAMLKAHNVLYPFNSLPDLYIVYIIHNTLNHELFNLFNNHYYLCANL